MAILNDAACGLLQTDTQGKIRWVNRVLCDWIGRESTALIGHRKIQEFFTVGGRIFHETHWIPLLQMQHSVSEVKFDVVHADGHTIPMIFNGIRRMRDGVTVHDLAVFIASDRDKYERELLTSRNRMKALLVHSNELEETARDRATFAEQMMGIVSHDLRNPLATVELSALAVLGGNISAEHHAALTRILRATSRATRLIRDLLDFTQARLGAGLAVTRIDVNLHALVSEGVEELRHTFPGRELVHVIQGSGQCKADPDRIIQLVGNLVTNAITYGRLKSPVTIVSSIDPNQCLLSVHNEGLPIEEFVIPELFRPMARGVIGVDGTRSVGLGLYIVREIAKAHAGEVQVTSTIADGTTFTAQFTQ